MVGITLTSRAIQRLILRGSKMTGVMGLGFAASVTGGVEADFLVGAHVRPILADGSNRTRLGSALYEWGILS